MILAQAKGKSFKSTLASLQFWDRHVLGLPGLQAEQCASPSAEWVWSSDKWMWSSTEWVWTSAEDAQTSDE